MLYYLYNIKHLSIKSIIALYGSYYIVNDIGMGSAA